MTMVFWMISNMASTEEPSVASIIKMQDEFSELMHMQDDNGGSRFSGKSVTEIANQDIKGEQLNFYLDKEAGDIQDDGMFADLNSQRNYKKKDINDLTALDAIQRSYIDLENISIIDDNGNFRAGFIEASSEIDKFTDVIEFDDTAERQSVEYSEQLVNNKVMQEYNMQCTESLLHNIFTVTSDLVVKYSQQPHKIITKEITASFSSKTYDRNNFSIDFQQGKITEIQKSEGTEFSISGKLGENFSENTVVKLKRSEFNSGKHLSIGNVSFSQGGLSTHPGFNNKFVAKFDIVQPSIKGRHGKARRNQYRGGELVYEFIDTKKYLPVIVKEYWEHDRLYDELVELGVCKLIEKNCLKPLETKSIGDREPYLNLTRECWQQQLVYRCDIPQADNDCSKIPANCEEEKQEFVEFFGQKAIVVKNFLCHQSKDEIKRIRIKQPVKTKPINEYQKNTDMGDAILALNFANDMVKDFKKLPDNNLNIEFFSGEGMLCNYTKGCCVDKDSGWEKLFHCNQQEKKLASQHRAKACAVVGNFEVKNSLLQKVKKITKIGYCCYGSHVARIIQQGAAKELHKSFGSPSSPQCRPLTVAELSKLDFSSDEYDFSDLIKDLAEQAQGATVGLDKIKAVQSQLQNNVVAQLDIKAQQIQRKSNVQTSIQKQNEKLIEERIHSKKMEDIHRD